jgi:predicted phage tail protein
VALASVPTVYVQTAQTTAARNTFSGLAPGQVYAVEVNAVGSAGASNWSNAADLMVI